MPPPYDNIKIEVSIGSDDELKRFMIRGLDDDSEDVLFWVVKEHDGDGYTLFSGEGEAFDIEAPDALVLLDQQMAIDGSELYVNQKGPLPDESKNNFFNNLVSANINPIKLGTSERFNAANHADLIQSTFDGVVSTLKYQKLLPQLKGNDFQCNTEAILDRFFDDYDIPEVMQAQILENVRTDGGMEQKKEGLGLANLHDTQVIKNWFNVSGLEDHVSCVIKEKYVTSAGQVDPDFKPYPFGKFVNAGAIDRGVNDLINGTGEVFEKAKEGVGDMFENIKAGDWKPFN